MRKPKSFAQQQGLVGYKDCKAKAIAFYGGACHCGSTDQLVVAPDGKTWREAAGQPLTSSYARYMWLARHAFPTGFVVKCRAHAESGGYNEYSQWQQDQAVQERARAREQVLAHYGGACARCGSRDRVRLMPVVQRDCSWERLIGSAKPKNRDARIVRAELPDGIELVCRPSCPTL